MMADMTTDPDQRWIPTDHNGRPVYNCRRHVRDCLHFYPEGDPALHVEHMANLAVNPEARVSYKREATSAEMLTIPACSTCGVVPDHATLITTCGRCHMELPATGLCACDD